MFKRLFGSKPADEPANRLATVRNITVGRTVSLDPLAWRRLGDTTRFTLDRDVLDITAQGHLELEGGQHVHRFYTDDHVMLQAMSDDAAGQENYDFTLFIPWTSAYPPGERERRRCTRAGDRVESVTMARTAARTSSRVAWGTQISSLTMPASRRAFRQARMRSEPAGDELSSALVICYM